MTLHYVTNDRIGFIRISSTPLGLTNIGTSFYPRWQPGAIQGSTPFGGFKLHVISFLKIALNVKNLGWVTTKSIISMVV